LPVILREKSDRRISVWGSPTTPISFVVTQDDGSSREELGRNGGEKGFLLIVRELVIGKEE